MNIRILYEDDVLFVVDKPAGMLVLPDQPQATLDLTSRLNAQFQEKGLAVRARPCHRIDKETSGLVLFAKSKQMQQRLMDQFRRRRVEKIYLAFIHGRLPAVSGELKSYIRDTWPYQRSGPAKLALTRYHVLSRGKGFSAVRMELMTGRTNQIRIQFSQEGHPLVGERRFARARDFDLTFRRAALHAWKMRLRHPITGVDLRWEAEVPADMQEFLRGQGVRLP